MTKEWEKPEDLRRRKPVLWLTMTALFMAMVVVLSMSALGMLAMMSARSDESLSLRSQDVARQVAELNVSAEQSLARLDALLADAARSAQG